MAHRLRDRLRATRMSQAELSSQAQVDPSQTSRILGGEFITLGGGVLRICKVLGIDPQHVGGETSTAQQARELAAWAKLQASMRRAWDRTPEGADRLAAVIDAVAGMTRDKSANPTVSASSVVENRQ